MHERIRILILEDNPADAELVQRELRKVGIDFIAQLAQDQASYVQYLDVSAPDIILVDYSLPGFDGLAAIGMARQRYAEIPAIIVSGAIGEETAIEALKAGATDYVLKDRLGRLGPVVERALREAEELAERKRAEEELIQSRERADLLATLLDNSAEPFACGRADGSLLLYNHAFEDLTGYSGEDLRAVSWAVDLTPAEYQEMEATALSELLRTGRPVRYEKEYIRKDGSRVPVELLVGVIYDDNDEVAYYYAFVHDMTERKAAEERERRVETQKRDFYRRTILAATNGRLEIVEPDEIHSLAGKMVRTWAFTGADQFRTARQEAFELAESLGLAGERLHDFMSSCGETMSNALKHAGGGQVSLYAKDGGIVLVVSDTGSGIETLRFPDVALVRGYSTAGTGGLGYELIIACADKTYLATGPEGTTVAVEFSLH